MWLEVCEWFLKANKNVLKRCFCGVFPSDFTFNISLHNLDRLQIGVLWWRENHVMPLRFGYCADDWNSVSNEGIKQFPYFSFNAFIWHLGALLDAFAKNIFLFPTNTWGVILDLSVVFGIIHDDDIVLNVLIFRASSSLRIHPTKYAWLNIPW